MCVTGEELKIGTLSPTYLDLSCCTTDISMGSACVLKGPPAVWRPLLRRSRQLRDQLEAVPFSAGGSVAHQAGGCAGGGWWVDSGNTEGKADLTR